jgi:hypothetical protein
MKPTLPAEPPSSVPSPPGNALDGDNSCRRRRDQTDTGATSDPSAPGAIAPPPCACAAPSPFSFRPVPAGSPRQDRAKFAKPTTALAEPAAPAVHAFRSDAAAAAGRRPSPAAAWLPVVYAFRSGGDSSGCAASEPNLKGEADASRGSCAAPAGWCAGGGASPGKAAPVAALK